jgi:hypothetical protein
MLILVHDKANQPAWRYGPKLWSGLGYIGKLKCGLFTERNAENFFWHMLTSSLSISQILSAAV